MVPKHVFGWEIKNKRGQIFIVDKIPNLTKRPHHQHKLTEAAFIHPPWLLRQSIPIPPERRLINNNRLDFIYSPTVRFVNQNTFVSGKGLVGRVKGEGWRVKAEGIMVSPRTLRLFRFFGSAWGQFPHGHQLGLYKNGLKCYKIDSPIRGINDMK